MTLFFFGFFKILVLSIFVVLSTLWWPILLYYCPLAKEAALSIKVFETGAVAPIQLL